jgi:hypothetical protein
LGSGVGALIAALRGHILSMCTALRSRQGELEAHLGQVDQFFDHAFNILTALLRALVELLSHLFLVLLVALECFVDALRGIAGLVVSRIPALSSAIVLALLRPETCGERHSNDGTENRGEQGHTSTCHVYLL